MISEWFGCLASKRRSFSATTVEMFCNGSDWSCAGPLHNVRSFMLGTELANAHKTWLVSDWRTTDVTEDVIDSRGQGLLMKRSDRSISHENNHKQHGRLHAYSKIYCPIMYEQYANALR